MIDEYFQQKLNDVRYAIDRDSNDEAILTVLELIQYLDNKYNTLLNNTDYHLKNHNEWDSNPVVGNMRDEV